MDEVANILEEEVPYPKLCPRCGKPVLADNNTYYCKDCGELYYDKWLGIFRIKERKTEE